MVIAKQTYKLPSNRECPRCGVYNTQQQTVKQTEQTRLVFPSKKEDIFGAFDVNDIDILTDKEKEDLRGKLDLDELTKENYGKLREDFFNKLTKKENQTYENNLIKDWHVTASEIAFKAINDKELSDFRLERRSKYLQTGGFFSRNNKVAPGDIKKSNGRDRNELVHPLDAAKLIDKDIPFPEAMKIAKQIAKQQGYY